MPKRSLVCQVVLLGGTSGLALLAAAAAPTEARAQATPGSPQCPIVNRIVTCGGDVSSGVRVPAGADRDGLTVETMTADVVVTTRPAIQFTAGTATTAIRVADADNALRVTTTTPDIGGRDVNLSAILATATGNTTFELTSDIDIFGRTICPREDGCVFDRALQVVGITVRGSGGSFEIENSGDIAIDSDEDGLWSQTGAIVADVFGADLLSIRNSGALTVHNGGGIYATADNDRIEIVNDGTIALTQDDGELVVYSGGIALSFNSTQNYSDGFARPDVPQVTDFSYSIINNGGIITNAAPEDTIAFNPAIFVAHIYTEQFDIGSADFSAGRQIGEIVNNGTIGGNFGGIYVEQNGDIAVTNNGEMTGLFGIDVEQLILEIADPGDVSLTRITNGADGVIDVGFEGAGQISGIFARGGDIAIENAGLIDATGEFANGIAVIGSATTTVFRPSGSFTIENSGDIRVSGPDATGIYVTRTALRDTGIPEVRTAVINSGTVEALGDGGDALYFDSIGAGAIETVGTTDTELTAASILRGGAGGGAGIRFYGGESNLVRNAGLITALSGDAILGDTGPETIDNSGRIEGAVRLGEDDDRIIARAGGLITGAVDGGDGTDAIAFDVASGSALFGDRIGGAATGFETLEKTGTGTLSLTEAVAARTALQGGALVTSGNLAAMGVDADSGTLLSATGTLGAVNLAGGASLSAGGTEVGALEMASLALAGTSRLRFDLGTAGVVGGPDNDLLTVAGDLVLDGLLDIDATLEFGNGVYRLIGYGGSLTDNGLDLGTVPAGDLAVQTAISGQVNLVVSGIVGPDLSIQFWDGGDTAPDGAIDGGAGSWSADATTWTTANGTFNAPWAGNFAVFQNAGGAVTVEGAQAVTGMQFTDDGYRLTAGTGGSIVLDAAETAVRVDPGITAELALPLTGAGALVKRDLGTLVLAGANTHSGGTQVREGVLQVSADTAFGSGGLALDGGTLRAGGTFTIARSMAFGAGSGTIDTQANTLTLSGALAGSGSLTKIGSGTLALTGNSTGYTGATRIVAGTLDLAGTLGGPLAIAAGATMTGSGGAASLDLGGILAPGNSPGVLTIAGDATFRAGSTYRAELAAAGASDRVEIGGRAIIEGGTVAITALDPELSYTDGAVVRILNAAGGRTGTFASLTESSAFLDFALGYDANGVTVTVDVVRMFPDVAATFNQRQASTGLMGFATGGADALSVYNALLLLDADPARAAFDMTSGEIYPVLVASELRRSAGLATRFLARGLARAGEGWGLWGGAAGHDSRTDGDGNGARYTADGLSAELGVDYAGSGNGWAVGLGMGYDDGGADLDARNSQGRRDGWNVGGYARYGTGGAGVTFGVSGAWANAEADVTRSIAFGAIGRTATTQVDVDSWALAGELRYGIDIGGDWAIGPSARIAHAGSDLGSFAEAGSGSLDLSGGPGNDDGRTRYGGGLFARWERAEGSIDASAAYLAGGDAPTEIGLRMAGNPAAPFRVRSARGDGGTAALTLAGDIELGGGWSIGGNLAGAFGNRERSVAGSFVLGWRF